MKKTYKTPETKVVQILGPTMMVEGSNRVNEFRGRRDIKAGDED
jgi:hypothetical protein